MPYTSGLNVKHKRIQDFVGKWGLKKYHHWKTSKSTVIHCTALSCSIVRHIKMWCYHFLFGTFWQCPAWEALPQFLVASICGKYVLHCPDIARSTFYMRLTLSRPHPYIYGRPSLFPRIFNNGKSVKQCVGTEICGEECPGCVFSTPRSCTVRLRLETRKSVFGPNMKVWLVCARGDGFPIFRLGYC